MSGLSSRRHGRQYSCSSKTDCPGAALDYDDGDSVWLAGQNITLHAFIVKLREREGQRLDLGRSLKGHLWMVDGGWWMVDGGIPFPDALH